MWVLSGKQRGLIEERKLSSEAQKMTRSISVILIVILLTLSMPVHASDQITYVSQPESVMIFLNNVALAQDTISLAGGADVQIVLPQGIFQDTLILREGGQRVGSYSINRDSGQVVLSMTTTSDSAVREVRLEYLFSGLSWKPTYDMWIVDDEQVQMDFLVEIQNQALALDNVEVRLVAGRVDTSQQVDAVSTVTSNQYIAGYVETEGAPAGVVGPVTIQHVYESASLSAEIGDTVYSTLLQADFPARRLILWNAPVDAQAQVIYKVGNDSSLPLAEGIVRSYQDDLFIGSDFIEVTPVGGEGSVTVGGVQDLRVNRSESQHFIENAPDQFDQLHEVTLTLSNFSEEAIELEVVDRRVPEAKDFIYSDEPREEPDNLLRWAVTVPPGETLIITYEFKTR
jgi:hypothetical protein